MHLSIGGWRVDFGARTAQKNGSVQHLSPRAIRLLDVLIGADGATLSRSELLDRIWPDVTVSDESLTQVVSELRRKLADRSLIETVSRGGYRLTAPVLREITASASRSPTQTMREVNLAAHALCLEARTELVRCGAGSIERAEELTAEAVDLAPDCPSVRSDRAIALVRRHMYWSESCDMLSRALAEAEKAVALDPGFARAHSVLGYALGAFGHWRAAEAAHGTALALDPRDASCYHHAAWMMMSRRNYRAAVVFFEQTGDLDPQNIKGYLQAACLSVAHDPLRSRRNAERALIRARTRLTCDPTDPRALTASGVLMALMGEPAAAYATIRDIDVSNSAQAVYHASTFAMIGELDRAVLCFEQLFDHGWRDVHWLDADPAFANIAGDRRFRRMRRGLAVA